MSDPFGGPEPPSGGPPRSTPLGETGPVLPPGSQPGFGAPPPGLGPHPPAFGRPPIAQPQWSQPANQHGGTNGLAIAAFVLGLLWLCTIGSLLGIIFGFVGLAQIKGSRQRGRGLAIAGIVLGVVGIVATIAVTVLVVNKADDVLEQDPGEVDDVVLEACGTNAQGRPEARLIVTNDSSKPSTYVIIVEFGGDGSTDAVEFTPLEVVQPGQRVVTTVSTAQDFSSEITCDITYVQRFANTGGSGS